MSSIPNLTDKQLASFLSKVDRSGGIDACWIWLGQNSKKDKAGYGKIELYGKCFSTSRVAYFICYKKDPGELLICHSCDNPPCVNPNHLFPGTPKDNYDDMISKDRGAKYYHNKDKTHCHKGHEFTEKTTRIYKGKRVCKTCATITNKATRLANKKIKIAKTHCPQGHPYNKENSYIDPRGYVKCRNCDKDRHNKKNRS